MISEEELDELMTEQKHIADLAGTIDYEHFLRFKALASRGLQLFEDDFLVTLGLALRHATDRDAVKIIRVWRNEVSQAEMMCKMHLARSQAL